ncbi:glycosyltransferase [Kozakia baliensis]|nr:glycosyltransferase [Kozakia baliensis]
MIAKYIMVAEPISHGLLAASEFSGEHIPLWAEFDPSWYRSRYAQAIADMAGTIEDDQELLGFWRHHGARHGHSPNRLFDELWYRRANRDVENGIRIGIFEFGYQHYCEIGFRARSGHWLFSEEHYFKCNPDLTLSLLQQKNYRNGYDHYLAIGDREHRSSHRFFDPDIFRSSLFEKRLPYEENIGAFSQFLCSPKAASLRTSWYFDPAWYLSKNPAVEELIASGEYIGPLHHYLSNDAPTAFNPHPYFSESFYNETYPDVAGIVQAGGLRNGYEHFLNYGIAEGRQPIGGVDFAEYSRQPGALRRIRQGRASEIFAQWVALQEGGHFEVPPAPMHAGQYAQLSASRMEAILPLVVRTPLDFSFVGTPKISVIIDVRNQFPGLLRSLTSLHESRRGDVQVIIVDAQSGDETASLEDYVVGVEIVRTPHRKQGLLWQLGIAHAQAAAVLLLEPGTTLCYGALTAACKSLGKPGVVAVGAQLLKDDLHVLAAGAVVFRDGNVQIYGEGLPSFSPEVGFTRICDAFAGGALLCDVAALRAVEIDIEFEDPTFRWVALSLALRQSGGKLLYDPCFMVVGARQKRASEMQIRQERVMLRQRFASLLRCNPAGAPKMEVRARSIGSKMRILVLAEQIPLHQRGGRLARTADIVRTLAVDGMQVTVCPIQDCDAGLLDRVADLPDNVEVIETCDPAQLGVFLDNRAQSFDAVWICGGSVLNRVSYYLHERAYALPTCGFVLDTSGLDAFDRYLQERQKGKRDERALTDMLEADLQVELHEAWFCQAIVTRSSFEAGLVRKLGYDNVSVLGEAPVSGPERDFASRSGLVFATPIYSEASAAYRDLQWLMREVFPRLDRRLPPDVSVAIASHLAPHVDLTEIARYRRVEPSGGLPDLDDLFSQRRVLLSPSLYAEALPYEAQRAAGFGLPTVMGGEDSEAPCLSVLLDPEHYADAVARLYQDEKLWRSVSEKARASVGDAETYRRALGDILRNARVRKED